MSRLVSQNPPKIKIKKILKHPKNRGYFLAIHCWTRSVKPFRFWLLMEGTHITHTQTLYPDNWTIFIMLDNLCWMTQTLLICKRTKKPHLKPIAWKKKKNTLVPIPLKYPNHVLFLASNKYHQSQKVYRFRKKYNKPFYSLTNDKIQYWPKVMPFQNKTIRICILITTVLGLLSCLWMVCYQQGAAVGLKTRIGILTKKISKKIKMPLPRPRPDFGRGGRYLKEF